MQSSLLRQALLQLLDLVVDLPALLLRQGALLLAFLHLLLQILNLLLLVFVSHHRLLVHLDLVAGTIVDLIRANISVVGGIVTHRLALDAQAAAHHDPLLGGHAITELLVVRDDEDAALVVLDGQHQGTQAITVQVVRGLVQDQNVRVLPHRRCQDDLHLHAAAELVDLSVAGRLRIHAEVAEVLLDAWLRQLLSHEPSHGSLPLVFALDQLDVAHLDQDFFFDPDRRLNGLELPLHLVLVGLLLLLLAAVHDGVRNHCARLVLLGLLRILLGVNAAAHTAGDGIDAPLLRAGFLLINGELLGLEFDALFVVVACEAPHDVCRGCLLHVFFQVVESMLSDIRHTQA
mmetsp:Transcript_16470/g.45647  ORF Transcript_16470/g.45647 Transcript_16470/m.45647 type:complete len:346 (-) Transcript_16470:1535-2572(-)